MSVSVPPRRRFRSLRCRQLGIADYDREQDDDRPDERDGCPPEHDAETTHALRRVSRHALDLLGLFVKENIRDKARDPKDKIEHQRDDRRAGEAAPRHRDLAMLLVGGLWSVVHALVPFLSP